MVYERQSELSEMTVVCVPASYLIEAKDLEKTRSKFETPIWRLAVFLKMESLASGTSRPQNG